MVANPNPTGSAQPKNRDWLWAAWRSGELGAMSTLQIAAGRTLQYLAPFFRLPPLVREILKEYRNVPARISAIRESKLYGYGNRIGTIDLRDDDLFDNKVTLACTADTQRIFDICPWVRVLEAELCIAAWKRGAKWAFDYVHTRHSGSLQMANLSCDAPCCKGSDSSPSLTVPQGSMHDPSDQLPLPESRATSGESGKSCTKQNTESQRLSDSPTSLKKHSSNE
jgi:hypothetical protein